MDLERSLTSQEYPNLVVNLPLSERSARHQELNNKRTAECRDVTRGASGMHGKMNLLKQRKEIQQI